MHEDKGESSKSDAVLCRMAGEAQGVGPSEVGSSFQKYFEALAGISFSADGGDGDVKGRVTEREADYSHGLGNDDPTIHALKDRVRKRDVIQRRLARVKRLRQLYDRAAEELHHELDAKHLRFIVKKGHQGTKSAHKGHIELLRSSGQFSECHAEGCDGKPVPFSKYCKAHILSDANQVLFKDDGAGNPVLRDLAPQIRAANERARKAASEGGGAAPAVCEGGDGSIVPSGGGAFPVEATSEGGNGFEQAQEFKQRSHEAKNIVEEAADDEDEEDDEEDEERPGYEDIFQDSQRWVPPLTGEESSEPEHDL